MADMLEYRVKTAHRKSGFLFGLAESLSQNSVCVK